MPEVVEIVEDENKIDTVIADDIEFTGKLVFANSLKIKGKFEGQIVSNGHLIIGQESVTSADIAAGTVSINGIANGKVKATKCVELFQKSQITGDIVTPDLYIEKGANFSGTCIMTKKA